MFKYIMEKNEKSIKKFLREIVGGLPKFIDECYNHNNSTKGGINMGNPMQKYDNRIRKETEIEVAIGALKEKIAPETVAKIVKLPLEQILELQKQITVTA